MTSRKGHKRCPRCGYSKRLRPVPDGSHHACGGCIYNIQREARLQAHRIMRGYA